jgi:hypothetical protein
LGEPKTNRVIAAICFNAAQARFACPESITQSEKNQNDEAA